MIKSVISSLVLVLAVSGCSSKFVSHDALAEDPQKSRYSMAQDRAPKAQLNANQIEETTPRVEPRSKHGNKSPYTVNGKSYRIMATAEGYSEEGIASWYGAKFHGHSTSNGEIFDMNKISAAHKTLPLPTWVKVTNLDNGESINVRVNDRGPFHGGRIIDLSYAAAVKLGFQDKGTARVKVETLSGPALDNPVYYLQVGAFSSKDSAQNLQKQLKSQLEAPVKVTHDSLYRVRIGPLTYSEALKLQARIAKTELGKPLLVAGR